MKHVYLLAGVLAGYLPGAMAVQFNTEALRTMQQEGQKIVEEAKATRAFRLPSGKCLHVAGDVTKPGANLVINECNANANNQKWRFDDQGRLVNQGGLCVGVVGDPLQQGANAVVQTCGPQRFQKWRRDGNKRLVNDLNKCLHAGDPAKVGANVVSATCNNSPNQIWD